MDWITALQDRFASGASHAFLLYLNISDDFVSKDGDFDQLRFFLAKSAPFDNYHFVAFFNRGTGTAFPTPDMEAKFVKFLDTIDPGNPAAGVPSLGKRFTARKADLAFMLTEIFTPLLEMPRVKYLELLGYNENRGGIVRSRDRDNDENKPLLAVVMEYAETCAPPESAHDKDCDRDALVTFLVWARSQVIERLGNIIVLVADALSAVAPALRSEANRVTPIKISYPNKAERKTTLDKLGEKQEYADVLTRNMSLDTIAHLTAGMTNSNLVQLAKALSYKKEPLTEHGLFNIKKKAIEELSGGKLEIVKPPWGLEAIGALEEYKRYIRDVTLDFKGRNLMAVPMGIFLSGGPGTGKTVFVEALAHEIGIPLIRAKNLREVWHGQSEKNLETVVEIAKANEPCIFFLDELDQKFQMRGTVFHGDSGVSARMQATFFEVMSDTNLRGKILWIGATNRPDQIDPAILREGRFDDKLPFFPPTAEERSQILVAILRKMEIQAQESSQEFKWGLSDDFVQEFGRLTHRHVVSKTVKRCEQWKPGCDDEAGLTGAEIEAIVARAFKIACRKGTVIREKHLEEAEKRFILSRNIELFDEMTRMALEQCNDERFVPEGRWKRLLGLQSSRPGPGHYL